MGRLTPPGGTWPRREKIEIPLFEKSSDARPVVPFRSESPACRPHLRTERWIDNQGPDLRSQVVHIAGSSEQPRLAVDHDRPYAREVAGDNRSAGRHAFEQHHPERLAHR